MVSLLSTFIVDSFFFKWWILLTLYNTMYSFYVMFCHWHLVLSYLILLTTVDVLLYEKNYLCIKISCFNLYRFNTFLVESFAISNFWKIYIGWNQLQFYQICYRSLYLKELKLLSVGETIESYNIFLKIGRETEMDHCRNRFFLL